MPETLPSQYDDFAWFYHKYWGSGQSSFVTRALPVLERFLLALVPRGGRILDLCCGTGQLAGELVQRGYQVTGVDGSAEMLKFARHTSPEAEFVHADVRTFALPSLYDGAVCLFDSLNHVMRLNELHAAFRNVRAVLRREAPFMCDFNMDAGYQARWQGSFGLAEDDHALVFRSTYDTEARVAQSIATMFRLEHGAWRRADLTMHQRCYSADEITGALRSTGFAAISTYDAERDLGMREQVGRTFFLSRRR